MKGLVRSFRIGIKSGLISRSLTTVIALSLFSLALPQSSSAEINADAVFEATLGVGFTVPSGDLSEYQWSGQPTLETKTGINLDVSGGYFISDLTSVGLALNYTGLSVDQPDGFEKFHFYSASVYVKYHFGYEASFTPYVRGQAGICFPNFSTPLVNTPGELSRQIGYDPCLTAMLSAGGRISTSDWSGLFFEVGYRYFKLEGSGGSYKGQQYELPMNGMGIQLNVGVSFDIAGAE